MGQPSITRAVLEEESDRFIHLGEDLAEIERFDMMILRIHLFVETYLEAIIEQAYPQPDLILEDSDLGRFDAKLSILEATGTLEEVMDDVDGLVHNIRMINRARNQIAHDIDWQREREDRVFNRIEAMEDLGTGVTEQVPLEQLLSFDGRELEFIRRGFEVIVVLATIATLLEQDD